MFHFHIALQLIYLGLTRMTGFRKQSPHPSRRLRTMNHVIRPIIQGCQRPPVHRRYEKFPTVYSDISITSAGQTFLQSTYPDPHQTLLPRFTGPTCVHPTFPRGKETKAPTRETLKRCASKSTTTSGVTASSIPRLCIAD